MATIGERLRDLIIEKGLSQKHAAELLGVKPSTIHGYITNRRDPDIETQKKIADIFGVSIDYLVGYSDVRYSAGKSADNDHKAPQTDELHDFVSNPLNREFIEFAKRAKDRGFNVEVLEALAEIIPPDRLNEYLRLLKKLIKKGIAPNDVKGFDVQQRVKI